MRLIARSTLVDYSTKHPATKSALRRWEAVVKAADWTNMSDVKATFPNGSVLSADRSRFEICFNDYRLIAAFNFRRQIAFVKFIGTHADYDVVDALTVAQF